MIWKVLPDELVQSLLGEGARAVVVHVGSVIGAGRVPVEEHPESRRRSRRGRSHDQVEVARQGPAVEPQLRRGV